MKKKIEEQALANVLKKATLKKPSPFLTEHILEQIQQEQFELAANESVFANTIKTAKTPSIASNFTYNIISELESQKQKPVIYRPLISKYIKYMYAVCMSLGILYLMISGRFSLGSLIKNFSEYSSNFKLLLTCCFSIILFAFIDLVLKKRGFFNAY